MTNKIYMRIIASRNETATQTQNQEGRRGPMNAEEKVRSMGTKKMLPMILGMSVPAVCGNIVNALYNIVDRIFVGQIVGRDALGAVGLVFPLNNITAALTIMMSIGGGALLSLNLGRREYEKVNRIFSSIVTMACTIGIFISAGFFFFTEPLIRLCGADETSSMFPMAVSYLKITAVGQFFSILNLALAASIRAEGNTKYAMIVTMTGAVINTFLDGALMILFHMGVEGAALATVASQIISCGLSVWYFKARKGVVRWLGFNATEKAFIGKVIALGMAPAVFQGLSFVNNILTNRSLMYYGTLELGTEGGSLAISAVSVIHTVENLAIMFIMGMNNAISTIISYNYGQKRYDRARQATLTGQAVAFAVSALLWVGMMFFPQTLFAVFSSSDTELMEYGARAMRLGKIFIFGLGFQTLASMFYSSIGKPKRAIFISISRNGLFLIPSLLILPKFFGINGVLMSTSVSDGCSLVLVIILYIIGIRDLNRLEKTEQAADLKTA